MWVGWVGSGLGYGCSESEMPEGCVLVSSGEVYRVRLRLLGVCGLWLGVVGCGWVRSRCAVCILGSVEIAGRR